MRTMKVNDVIKFAIWLTDKDDYLIEEMLRDFITINNVDLIEPTACTNINAVLCDDRANYENAIYDLIFAYANKDEDMPHTFEHDAVKNGYNLLIKSHQREFAKKIIEDMTMTVVR